MQRFIGAALASATSMALAALLSPETTRDHHRTPEANALVDAVRRHLATFRLNCDPPAFVARAFQRFLDCGVLAKDATELGHAFHVRPKSG